MSRLFSIVGDSNVRRNMTGLNIASREAMKSAQVIDCELLSSLEAALAEVRAESTICVVSCITNFLSSSSGSDSAAHRVEPVLLEVLEKLTEFSTLRPDILLFICPPMYRLAPIWYREGLPEILQKFSDVMKARPDNSFLMPSFPTPQFQSDGVHLSPYSGLEFVLHLFDSV